jgi:hypothetical protein
VGRWAGGQTSGGLERNGESSSRTRRSLNSRAHGGASIPGKRIGGSGRGKAELLGRASVLYGLLEECLRLAERRRRSGQVLGPLDPEGPVRVLAHSGELRQGLSIGTGARASAGRLLLGVCRRRCRGHRRGRAQGRRQGRLVAVGAVEADGASTELAGQEDPELEGRAELHAHRPREVLLRE